MNTILPPELLIKILLRLNSIELTRVSYVCRLWKTIVETDPCLARACFKQPSPHYYDEGCEPILFRDPTENTRVRFHPAMHRISYRMGDSITTVQLRNPSNDDDICRTPLVNLPLQTDYATVPATTDLDIEVIPAENNKRRSCSGLPGITITVSNPAGIRLGDIFSSIVKEATELCDLVAYASRGVCYQRMQPSLTFHKKAEILGKHKSYTGISGAVVEAGRIKAQVCTVP
ncbi:hypothetical protein P691DRAFT_804490 [Macrolepiota fuliginosa MF-IS2]|uniref:F-box domain-containing protein n=1 Tax=Macrolepiota fuliginosa MF-IS2 TaxID=1400762 RepID=A0A9P5X9J1_9AGAR|nr:hypothetical protein P691DRAFT_804490 [Macrolepiota fuliginosa MF-IS2]